jgi:methylated-DNA-[protein]-cysteine S-methyltransferase
MPEISARTVIQTPLGKIAISATELAVVALEFLPAKSKLQDFSDSKYAEQLVQDAKKQLVEYLAGKRTTFDLKLSPQGTKFQQQVWKQIEKIPFGSVTTYGAIAKAIKRPLAARAVGGAVGANPIAIFIGCHRVMGSTGALTGYSGGNGLPTKRRLLELEGIEYR